MGEWAQTALSNVAVITSGKRPPRVVKEVTADCQIPVIGGGGPSGFTDSALFDGKILITGRVGTLGKLIVPTGPCWPSDNALVIRPSSATTDARFLRYAIQLVIAKAADMNRGAANPLITQGDLGRLSISHPSVPVQRAIAHILGTLDDKIELNRKQNETLEAMARALFKAWFVDFEPVRAKMEGRWRRGQSLPGLPAHLYDLFPDRLVESELGEIPEGWQLGTIEDLCSSISSGGTPTRKNPRYWSNGTIPWFKTGELDDGPLIDAEEKINETALAESSCKLWPAGTILFALYASPTVGRIGILTAPGTSNQAAAG